MAKIELKHICLFNDENFIKAELDCNGMDQFILISGENEDNYFCISLDKSTAIKFAKTLRTEINKIESEV